MIREVDLVNSDGPDGAVKELSFSGLMFLSIHPCFISGAQIHTTYLTTITEILQGSTLIHAWMLLGRPPACSPAKKELEPSLYFT